MTRYIMEIIEHHEPALDPKYGNPKYWRAVIYNKKRGAIYKSKPYLNRDNAEYEGKLVMEGLQNG